MKIGEFEIFPMEYGRFKLDGGAMFGVVPKVLWQKYSPADENNQIDMALRGMLIKTGDSNILVDTGVGHKMSDKLNKIFAIDNNTTRILDNNICATNTFLAMMYNCFWDANISKFSFLFSLNTISEPQVIYLFKTIILICNMKETDCQTTSSNNKKLS